MKKAIIFIFFSIFLSSCANYKMHYSNTVADWEQKISDMPTEVPQYALYGIGDAGYLPDGKPSLAIIEAERMIKGESGKSGIVFIGDNIYPSGMPKKDDDHRQEAQQNIDVQINAVKNYNGDIFFIPGNHDWRQEDGPKGIRRQEQYIEKQLNAKVHFPNDGCSGPFDFKLTKDVALIIIDSEWYLQDWDKHIDFNEKCDFQTRFDFIYELKDLIKKYAKDKRLVIALHHPLYTNGNHGGKFGAKDYILPLSNLHPPINVPLPGLGLLYPILRKNAGVREDVNGERYKELRTQLLAGTDVFDNVIFLSGHEHNMQYIFREDHHHIIAGSGSKTTPVGMGQGAEFSVAEIGFSRISFYNRGETWVEYFSCKSGSAKLVFAKKLTDKLTEYEPAEENFEPPRKPYVEAAISDVNMDKGGLFRFFMGRQYSGLYNKPIKARVTNLSIKEGGLSAVKRGGGFQTNSVRLQDSKERDWVMRAMRKDPSKLLPDEFMGTVAIDAVDYFLTTAHPLAAYTITPMAKAIDIMYTKPELVYIPKQTALGVFNEDHGDKLYLFEDRPAGDRSDRDNFNNSEKIISTLDLVEKMKDNGKHRPEQTSVVRSRLFDMVIGDWDRHDDQWRWARFDGPNKTKEYKPIPRDRDQAFSIFEGLLVGIARVFSPGIAKFQTFDHKVKNIEYFNFNARYFDRSFMNELTWEDWQKEITHIQSSLTDEIIHKGINQMQDDFYQLHGAEIEAKLQSRRNALNTYAKKYYKSLAKIVSVHGTNGDDLIEVIKNNSVIQVKFSEINKKGKIKHTYYDRMFKDGETKEIRLYGLDGDDKFVVTGSGSKIKVRMIGGTDHDEFTNEGTSGKNHVYDVKKKTKIGESKGLNTHLSNDYQMNAYDRKDFVYNHSFALPLFAFNPDNGFLLGGMFTGTWHGFKKDPYKASHTISALYSFETEGFKVDYSGRFIDVFGPWNLKLQGNYQDEFFTTNYFGLGNDSENPESEELGFEREYNRLRQSIIQGKLHFEKELGKTALFHFGPKIDIREVDYTADRFVSNPKSGLMEGDAAFEKITYVGGDLGFAYRNVDNEINPHQGVDIDISADYLTDIDDKDLRKMSFIASLSMYIPLDHKENFVWAHKVGSGFNFGDKALFYHQQQLGGQNGLRGFRNERFTGTTMFHYSTDIRIRMFDFNSFFAPSTVGVYGGFDVGRVAIEEENSDAWHSNFGGGLWINPFNMAIIKVGYFASDEEQGRLLIGLGFDF